MDEKKITIEVSVEDFDFIMESLECGKRAKVSDYAVKLACKCVKNSDQKEHADGSIFKEFELLHQAEKEIDEFAKVFDERVTLLRANFFQAKQKAAIEELTSEKSSGCASEVRG